ncbi:MAG TPA: hypothetical protein VN451_11080, partial [Chitinophagaceae bacterium]|nr:hypothetical protein [Chitinophagaceae bacterium]
NEVCLKIVLYYFHLYNSWKSLYEKEKDRNLLFLEKDYKHPYTYDKVLQYFKNKYPKDYISKSAALLDIKPEELLKYESDRDYFYNLFR